MVEENESNMLNCTILFIMYFVIGVLCGMSSDAGIATASILIFTIGHFVFGPAFLGEIERNRLQPSVVYLIYGIGVVIAGGIALT